MRRVVVTGMGAVTPLGHTVEDFWSAIRSGESGVGPITQFDASDHATKYAAEVKEFDAKQRLDRRDARKMDRFSQFTVYSAMEAWEDAGFGDSVDKNRVGVIMGNGIGGFNTTEESLRVLDAKGPSRVPPMTIPKMITNIAPANVALALGVHGPVFSLATACASATDAIGQAVLNIRAGIADVVVSGGVEASITPLGVAGFNVIGALSTNFADDPKRSSRPFDKDRDGFVMAEGAGVLVLEDLEHAQARGARIYAEVAGYGITNDAFHLTAPDAEGAGAASAMQLAVKSAGLELTDVDYINAHGTSTPLNDPTETKAIKRAFGDHAYKLAVSSTKSMHGHMIGATGATEAITCIKGLQEQFYPPTINLDEPDPECDLDYVPNKGREKAMKVAISNSLGFGGHNSVLVLTKPE